MLVRARLHLIYTDGDGVGIRINYAKAAEFARLSALERNESDR